MKSIFIMEFCSRICSVLWDAKKARKIKNLAGFSSNRSERIRTSDLYVPNVALYQAKLRSVKIIL